MSGDAHSEHGGGACCGACAGGPPPLAAPSPRAGLPFLPYRVGRFADFKAAMLAAIGRQPTLVELKTRRDDDPTIALCDAWAVALDVLTFYQERGAQELFLRTAVERRSLLELARLVGYKLRPGVAAETWLAFELDPNEGSPTGLTLPPGVRAQSLPAGPEELPQSFETLAPLVARPAWNALRPRRTAPQTLTAASRSFYLEGVTSGLAPGHRLLLAVTANSTQRRVPLEVLRVEVEAALNRTLVVCEADASPPTVVHPELGDHVGLGLDRLPPIFRERLGGGAFFRQGVADRVSDLEAVALDSGPSVTFGSAGVLRVQAQSLGLGRHLDALGAAVTAAQVQHRPPAAHVVANATGVLPAAPDGVYALRATAGIFGRQAPRWSTLPAETRSPYTNWDNGLEIFRSSLSGAASKDAVHLERELPALRRGHWLLLEQRGKETLVLRVGAADPESVAEMALSGAATRLQLFDPATLAEIDYETKLDGFEVRGSMVHTQSELLTLAELPIEVLPAGTTALALERTVLDLERGRTLLVRGKLRDLPTQTEAEAVTLDAIEPGATETLLRLQGSLVHSYLLQTVEILANVARASHGESVAEVIGSGDGAAPFQRFALRHNPLTYVSSEAPSGGDSTLEVWVDGTRWREESGFYPLGARDRAFVVEQDDAGKSRVLFGDGERGARLPTGSENVVASYRHGLGVAGHVAAGAISLLATRPLGVRGVVNPLPSRGGQDAERRDDARRNMPRSVLTLGRVVSLRDYEDFAAAFAGIGKARADWAWQGDRRLVYLSVLDAEGAPPDPELLQKLRGALDAARDHGRPVRLAAAEVLPFWVEAKLKTAPDRRFADVREAAERKLRERFGFAARQLGQRLHFSELLAALHEVPGVVAVDLDRAHTPGAADTADALGLRSLPARYLRATRTVAPAQMLVLDPASEGPVALTPMA
jgi:predicted phage baseplate assembly protein